MYVRIRSSLHLIKEPSGKSKVLPKRCLEGGPGDQGVPGLAPRRVKIDLLMKLERNVQKREAEVSRPQRWHLNVSWRRRVEE